MTTTTAADTWRKTVKESTRRRRGKMLRVALLGATDHANHFVPLLNTFEAVDIVGVWDYDFDTAREFARANGVGRVFERPEDALECADAAVIPIHGRPPRKKGERWGDAPSDHLRLSRIFLEDGKAVFATRPFATEVRDAEKMVALAQENRTTVMSCSALRYDRGIQRLRRQVEDGSLGRVRTWSTTVSTRFPDREVTVPFYGVHGVEMAYAAVGTGAEWVQTTRTWADGGAASGPARGPASSVFVVGFTGGRVMVGQLLDGCPEGGYSLSVYGEGGVGEARPAIRYAALPYKPWIQASTEGSRDNYFRIMFHQFVRAARTGIPAIPYGELLEITRVLAAVERSARSEGRRVTCYPGDL